MFFIEIEGIYIFFIIIKLVLNIGYYLSLVKFKLRYVYLIFGFKIKFYLKNYVN